MGRGFSQPGLRRPERQRHKPVNLIAACGFKIRLRDFSVLTDGIQSKAPWPDRAHQFLYVATMPLRHRTVDFAMMPATERNHELITYLAGQSAALGKTKMMGIGWAAATNKTGFRVTERTCSRSRIRRGSGRLSSLLSIPPGLAGLASGWHVRSRFLDGRRADVGQPGCKQRFHMCRVRCSQPVLYGRILMRPFARHQCSLWKPAPCCLRQSDACA